MIWVRAKWNRFVSLTVVHVSVCRHVYALRTCVCVHSLSGNLTWPDCFFFFCVGVGFFLRKNDLATWDYLSGCCKMLWGCTSTDSQHLTDGPVFLACACTQLKSLLWMCLVLSDNIDSSILAIKILSRYDNYSQLPRCCWRLNFHTQKNLASKFV